ncbi:MAG: hypothetical protein U1E97_01050 [Alphaproteobacteria bacterium]
MLRFHPLPSPSPDRGLPQPPERGTAGAIVAALLIDESSLFVLGCTPEAPFGSATARLGQTGAAAAWHSKSWPREGGQSGHWFLGHLGFENIAAIAAGGIQLVPEGGGRAMPLPAIPRIELAAQGLLTALIEAKAPTAALLDFLRAARASAGPNAVERWDAFLGEYLRNLSHQSGFIEMIAAPECGGVLFQGWSFALAAGERPLVIETSSVAIHGSVVATFARSDLMDDARGVVVYLKGVPESVTRDLRRVYFEADGEIRHLDTIDSPIRFAPADSVQHLRKHLPVLQADVAVLRSFKRVCRPRFEGANTLESMAHPVRLVVDVTLDVSGQGIFLSGWLLDPRNLVRLVLLKSTANYYGRVHDVWSRRPRPDVNAAFAQDPRFAAWLAPGLDLHGFVAFMPRKAPLAKGEKLYVEIVLDDETCAFLPVECDARPVERVVREVLSAVRLDDPTLETLIGHHIGPAVSGALAARPAPGAAAAVTSFGIERAAPRVSVILSTEGDGADLDIHMARWSTDRDFAAAEIVIVAPRAVGERLAVRLKKQAAFYGQGGRLVLTHDTLDACDAIEIGVAHARADRLLFLAESVFSQAPGWLSRLEADLARHPGAGAVSPTLLYEDFSIHFAGLSQVEEPGASVDRLRRFSGYPRHWLTETEVTPVHAIAIECCLVPRESFTAIGGFSREFTDATYKALDFSRRLGAAGRPCLWSPAVDLFALDPDRADHEGEYWMRPAREVDAWRFGEKWAVKAAAGGQDKGISSCAS